MILITLIIWDPSSQLKAFSWWSCSNNLDEVAACKKFEPNDHQLQ